MKVVIGTHGFSQSTYKVGSFHISKILSNTYSFEVLNISIPVSPLHLTKISNSEIRKKFKICYKGIYKTNYGFYEYIPFTLFPASKKFFISKSLLMNLHIFSLLSIKKMLAKHKFDNIDILFLEHSNLIFLTKVINYKKLVYRITDIYPIILENKRLYDLESQIIEKCDEIIVTSIAIKEFIEENFHDKVLNKNIKVIENGVDTDHFLNKNCKRFSYPTNFLSYKNRVIYVGSIDRRLDIDLLIYVAKRLLKDNIGVFIFGKEEGISLKNYKFPENLHFMGPISFSDLPCILKKADVGILPFKQIKENDGRSPMKLYEYGICRLPVVSSFVKDIVFKKEDFVLISHNANEFYKNIILAIDKRDYLGDLAYEKSLKMDWKNMVKKLLDIVITN